MTDDDDDEAFDENGLLKDGKRFRLSLMMADALQREVRDFSRNFIANRGVVYHTPPIVDAAMWAPAERARAKWIKQQSEAWRRPPHPEANSLGTTQLSQKDQLPLQDPVEQARRAWIDRMCNAWRRGRP
jgi:hypothetical protein